METTGIMATELATVRDMMDQEIEVEVARNRELVALLAKLAQVVEGKTEIVSRETELLTQIQDLKGQTVEAVIQKKFEEAASAKASLISIELMLIETMNECSDQLKEELTVMEERIEVMQSARSLMPEADDIEGVRSYKFSDIASLQALLLKTESAVAESESKVSKLRGKITTAMDQRSMLLGSELEQPEPEPVPVATATAAGVGAGAGASARTRANTGAREEAGGSKPGQAEPTGPVEAISDGAFAVGRGIVKANPFLRRLLNK